MRFLFMLRPGIGIRIVGFLQLGIIASVSCQQCQAVAVLFIFDSFRLSYYQSTF